MSRHDPIAYTYGADIHCPYCTLDQFGQDERGFVPADAEDFEGNPIHPVFSWDEWFNFDDLCETLVCGDCFGEIDTAHADPHSPECPEFEPDEYEGATPRQPFIERGERSGKKYIVHCYDCEAMADSNWLGEAVRGADWHNTNTGHRSEVYNNDTDREDQTAMNANDIGTMVSAYIDCALWAGLDWSDSESDPAHLDDEYGEDDLSPDALAEIASECNDFYDANAADLADMSPEQAGHDFYLTRNGHGAGFWDRGLGNVGTRLTDAAHVYGTSELMPDGAGKLDLSY